MREQKDRYYAIALMRASAVTGQHVSRLVSRLGSLKAIFAHDTRWALLDCLSEQARRALLAIDWRAVDRDWQWYCKQQMTLVTYFDEDYPELLRQIDAPPWALLVWGDEKLLNQPQIAMVGGRHPTPMGYDNAYYFASNLAAQNWVITSGMARGIDGAAHAGVLASSGKTVGVMGCGLDKIYPAQHVQLGHQIKEQGGALISEFPRGVPPHRANFPKRNRLISGLAHGVLVVEATERSGSLITASQALKQNREVLAMPGSIHNPTSRGCHKLIREGAKLVETVQDVIEELPPLASCPKSVTQNHSQSKAVGQQQSLTANERRVLMCLDQEPASVDWLISKTLLSYQAVIQALVNLEMGQYIELVAGGYCKRYNPQLGTND